MKKIQIKFGHWLPKYFEKKSLLVYPFVLFSQTQSEVTRAQLKHQLCLVSEARRLGVVWFYLKYLGYTLFGLLRHFSYTEAHFNNPLEMLAYKRQAYPFTRWEKEELGLGD